MNKVHRVLLGGLFLAWSAWGHATPVALPILEDFNDGQHAWEEFDLGDSADFILADCGGAQGLCLQITNQAAQPEAWYVQPGQTGFSNLVNGGLYTGSLALKSEVARTVEVSLMQTVAPFANYGLTQACAIGPDWQACSFTFSAQNNPQLTPDDIRFAVSLGDLAGTVWLDDFQLGPVPVLPAPQSVEEQAARLTPLKSTPVVVFSATGKAILKARESIPAWFDTRGIVPIPVGEIQSITWNDWQGADSPGTVQDLGNGLYTIEFPGLASDTEFGSFQLRHQNETGEVISGYLLLDGFGVVPKSRVFLSTILIGYQAGAPLLTNLEPQLTPAPFAPVAVFSGSGIATAKFSNPAHFWFSEQEPAVPVLLTPDTFLVWDGTITSEQYYYLKEVHPWGKRRGYVTDNGDGSVFATFNGMPLTGAEGNIMIIREDGALGWALENNVQVHGVDGAIKIDATQAGFGYATQQKWDPPLAALPFSEDFEDRHHWLIRENPNGSVAMALEACGTRGQCLRVNKTATSSQPQTLVKQIGFSGLEAGKTYRLALEVKASQAFSLPVDVMENVAPYGYFASNFACDVTTEWTTCEREFIAKDNLNYLPENIALALTLGHFAGSLWVDNLFLGVPGTEPPTPTPSPPPSVSDTAIINLSVSDMVNPSLSLGFIASGQGTAKVLLRAWNLEFAGIPSVDPVLTVKLTSTGNVIATNDGWQTPVAPCQAVPSHLQAQEFTDPRNAACYLDITPGEGYVIELTAKHGTVAQAQLSADVEAGGGAALTNGSTSFYIHARNRGNAGMGAIVSGGSQLQALIRIWNLGFVGVDPDTDPTLLLRRGDNLATLGTNDNFASATGACQAVTNAILVNPEFYQEPRNAACLTSVDSAFPLHILGDTPVDGRIQMSLDLLP